MSKDRLSQYVIDSQLFNSGPVVIFVWKNESHWPVELVTQNINIYGYTPDQYLTGQLTYSEQIHPDDLKRVTLEVHNAIMCHTCNSFTHDLYRYLDGFGNYRWVKDITCLIRDDQHRVTHFVGYLLDVTDEVVVKEEAERYRLALSALDDGLWDWNIVTNEVYFSPQWKKMIGFEENELFNTLDDWKSRVHPDDLPKIYLDLQNYFSGKTKSYINEHRLLTKQGSYKWILDRGVIIERNEDDTPKRLIGTHTDIDARKALETQWAIASASLDASKDGVYWISLHSHIISVNKAACDMLDYSYSELTALTIPEIDPNISIKDWYGIVLHLKSGNVIQVETQHRSKSGQLIDVAITGNYFVVNGQDYIFAIARDLTQEKKSQRDMERMFHILQRAEKIAKLGSWSLDLMNDHLEWSDEIFHIFEIDRSKFNASYQFFLERVHPDDRDRVNDTYRQSLKMKQPYKISHRLLFPDGRIKYVLEVANHEYNHDGVAILSSGIVQDITEQYFIEQQLLEEKEKSDTANRAKSTFLANMSHEVRTPLSGVIGLTDIVLATELTDQQRDYLEKIASSANALLVVVNDILDYSKMEAGKMMIEHVAFDSDQLVKQINSLFSHRASQKSIILEVTIDKAVPKWLIGDNFRISQVIHNLVGNAIKFTQKGSVDVRINVLSKSSSKVRLKFLIKDTGIGMTDAQKMQVFQPFVQADVSNSRKYGGTGLGLIISQQLLKLMNASIQVESEFGIGSVFSFELMLGYKENNSVNIENKTFNHIKYRFIGNVLVVEDNDINQLVINEVLRGYGLNVIIVNNGLEAVNTMKKGHFDLVLMDLQMPVMDGFEATKIIRKFDNVTPIFALSAAVMTEDKLLTADCGMNGHIAKPIQADALESILKKYFIDASLTSIVVQKNNDQDAINNEVIDVEGAEYSSSTLSSYMLPDIKGIDMNALINRVGSLNLALMLLETFMHSYRDFSKSIALLDVQSSAFSGMLHKLKGVSGNLSLYAIYDKISQIESAIDSDQKHQMLIDLLELLDRVLSALETSKNIFNNGVGVNLRQADQGVVSLSENCRILLQSLASGRYMRDDEIEANMQWLNRFLTDEQQHNLRFWFASLDYESIITLILDNTNCRHL